MRTKRTALITVTVLLLFAIGILIPMTIEALETAGSVRRWPRAVSSGLHVVVPLMILSVPIMVVLKILCERFEGSRPVAELLAGRVDAFVSSEPA